MKYTVKHIFEEDCGCEGRQEGQQERLELILEGEKKEERVLFLPVSEVEEKSIREGDALEWNFDTEASVKPLR